MKSSVIGILFMFSSFIVSAGDFNGKFLIDGKVDGLKSGAVYISYDNYQVDRWISFSDTATLINGLFQFHGIIDEPKRCRIVVGPISTIFYIDASNMTVRLFSNYPDSVLVKGSMVQEDNVRLTKMVRERKSVYNQAVSRWEAVQEDSSKLDITDWQIEKDKWLSKLDSLSFDCSFVVLANFITSNPSSYISLLQLNSFMTIGWTKLFTTKQARQLFNGFPKAFQMGSAGRWGDKLIKQKENIEIGAIAPDFCVSDWKGNQLRLSDLRGKYVLIDFWATWCGTCIEEQPAIMTFFKKYHSKGLEILAISKDFTKDNWLSGIQKYKLEDWHHVMGMKDPERFWNLIYDNDDIVEKYPVYAIPKKILIDKDGYVIGTWGNGSDSKPLNVLLETIFTSNI